MVAKSHHESRDLTTMHMKTLFGKLKEHELELGRLKEEEEECSKKKRIALKVNSKKLDNDSDSENLNLMARKLSKFLRNKNKSIGQQLSKSIRKNPKGETTRLKFGNYNFDALFNSQRDGNDTFGTNKRKKKFQKNVIYILCLLFILHEKGTYNE